MDASTAAPRLPRMPGIDGLRAIAVLAVFAYHARLGWAPGGFLGVDVFFVISGYLITSLLLAEHAGSGRIALGRFWARRARRLLPALFVLLAVCLAVGGLVGRAQVDLRGDALAAIFYVANWRFIAEQQSYFAQFGHLPLLRHLWSLSVEEQFYVLWPPLLVLALRLRLRRFLPLLVAAGIAGSTALMWELYRPGDASRAFYGTDTRCAPLLVGVLLALVWRPGALPRVRRRPFARPFLDAASLAGLAGVVYAVATVQDQGTSLYHGGFLALAAASAVLLGAVAHPDSALARVLGSPVPRWLGERSYAVYLWHWPVLVLTPGGADGRLGRWPVLALQLLVTLALAELSFRFVERPIRSGALQRLRVRWGLVAQPRTPIAVGLAATAALAALAAVTPERAPALPPGFTAAALAASTNASTHLLRLPRHVSSKRPLHRAAAPAVPRSGPILAVGDSVLLGASWALTERLGRELRVDAAVSRQPGDIIDRLLAYRAEHALPRRVIVHIGDNGPVYYADWQRLKAALADVPLVVLVNVRVDRSWQAEVDREMREAVVGWKHATIADWLHASERPGTVVDGTHTSLTGARLFAAVIERALRSPHLGGVTR